MTACIVPCREATSLVRAIAFGLALGLSRHDNLETLLSFGGSNVLLFVNTTESSALQAPGHLNAPHPTQLLRCRRGGGIVIVS